MNTGFSALANSCTRCVILGSFPSETSLSKHQYYGHPRNHFWFLMSCILNEPLLQWPYSLRCACLLEHKIGLWDTVGACQRSGSLDSAIKYFLPNDPAKLLQIAPQLRGALFNGSFAQKHIKNWEKQGLLTLPVPSSSPANATHSFELKLAAWRKAILSVFNDSLYISQP
ncbi:MAG: DNA-deoxyinosine glycosylase [Burkholderiaceae bacterium]|nr:DNA-deoxyinosine glycosylase [Burkholderiaceae bacterium]